MSNWLKKNAWWFVLLLTIIGVTGVPHGDEILMRDGVTKLNDFMWFFFSHDLVLFFLAYTLYLYSDQLIWKALALLAFGKIIDETFPYPYKWHVGEIIWVMFVIRWAFKKFIKSRR